MLSSCDSMPASLHSIPPIFIILVVSLFSADSRATPSALLVCTFLYHNLSLGMKYSSETCAEMNREGGMELPPFSCQHASTHIFHISESETNPTHILSCTQVLELQLSPCATHFVSSRVVIIIISILIKLQPKTCMF